MTQDDAIKLAQVLENADDHIVIGNMIEDLNNMFPEVYFYRTNYDGSGFFSCIRVRPTSEIANDQ